MKFGDLAVGPAPQLPLDTFVARRRALAKKLGDGHVLVVATHTIKQYSHDVDYLYRPHSDFWYLTGFAEPGALLVLHGGSGATTLFLRDRKPEAEIWTGRRLGAIRAAAALAVDQAYPIEELATRLPALLAKAKVHAICDHDPAIRRRVRSAAGSRWVEDPGTGPVGGSTSSLITKQKAGPKRTPHGRQLLHEMRLIKDAAEVRLLKKACDLGVEAHLALAQRVRPGATEFQVEADFAHHARAHGSTGVGYPSICGCGPNGAVLHYVSNLGPLRDGELFLVDAGCEWGYYTSDITRTYPVGGAFSRTQLPLYELVHAAQKAALREVKPGAPFRRPHEKAVETIAAGLIDLGYIDGPFEKAVSEKRYHPYFMHGTSHWLGLDVHDAGGAIDLEGRPRRLKEGMVLTVEPGLYFNKDFAPASPRDARGIGIRIEDDVLVTGSGRRNLTAALPSDASDVAALVAPKR